MSPGQLTPPVIHGETYSSIRGPYGFLCPSLTKRLSQEIKGSSDTGPHGESCLSRQFGLVCGGWDETRKQRGAGRAQLLAGAQWPAAVQSQVSSPVPWQSPGLLHLGLHCKEMALGRITPQGQHLEKALGTSTVPAPWHQALRLGEPDGAPGRGILASTWHKL